MVAAVQDEKRCAAPGCVRGEVASRICPSRTALPDRASNGATPAAEEPIAARPSTMAESLLGDGEIVLLELKPSLWFVPLVSAPVAGFGLLLVLAGKLSWMEHHMPEAGRVLVLVGGFMIALRIVWAILQWLARVYILTDRRVLRQKGVLNRNIFECRLDRIQNTFVEYTIVQRALGVGTIHFATAGTRQVEAAWQHIAHTDEVHREVQRALSRYGRMGGV